MQILWLLYFTSEDDGAMLRVFNTGSRGALPRGSPNTGIGRVGGSMANGSRASMTHGAGTGAVSFQGTTPATGGSMFQGFSAAGGNKSQQHLGVGPSQGDLHDGTQSTHGGVGGTSLIGDHQGDNASELHNLKARALYSCEFTEHGRERWAYGLRSRTCTDSTSSH